MKNARLLSLLLLCALLLTACGGTEAPIQSTSEPQTAPSPAAETPASDPYAAAEPAFDFAQLEGWTFLFTSGAGGWGTEMTVAADGSFTGRFHDSEMGDITDEHPSGVLILSEFTGHFTQPEPVNDYSFSLQIADIQFPQGDRQEIADGTLYEYTSSAYGLDGAEELLLYLPGAPIAELPEMYLNWVRSGFYLYEEGAAGLPGYGLYNVTEENGFSSYRADALPEPTAAAFDPALALELAIDEAQTEAVPLEEQLAQAATQADMNEAAAALYQVWDGALNRFWQTLREHLPEEEMQALTKEQLAWIAEKEAAVQAAQDAVDGGTMAALAGATAGTEATKARMNELLDSFRANG